MRWRPEASAQTVWAGSVAMGEGEGREGAEFSGAFSGSARGQVRVTLTHIADRALLYVGLPCAGVYFGITLALSGLTTPVAINATLVGAGALLSTWGRRLSSELRGRGYVLCICLFAFVVLLEIGPQVGVGAFLVATTIGAAVFAGRRGIVIVVGTTVALFFVAGLIDSDGLSVADWIRGGVTTVAAMYATAEFVLFLADRMDAAHGAAVRALQRERAERAAHEEAERELARVRRVEAVARLAGGVAHEVNNALMVVLGNAEMMLSHPLGADQAREMLGDIVAATKAAGATVQALASLHGPTSIRGVARASEATRVAVAALVEEAPAGVTLAVTVNADGDGDVRMGADDLERVLGVLIRNAWEAMPDGGRVEITVGVEGHARLGIAVLDHGVGMPADVLERVFEPFFTTKPEGEGASLGLGLAWVFGAVHRAGGDIDLWSEVGEGTRVTVLLPRV